MRVRGLVFFWLGLLLACSSESSEGEESPRVGGKSGKSGAAGAIDVDTPGGSFPGSGGAVAGCGPGVCYPPPPPGWEGPSLVRVLGYASPEPAPAGCAGPERAYLFPAGGPAQCAPCSCGPGGVPCSARLLCYLGSTTCGGASLDVTAAVTPGCFHSDDPPFTSPQVISCQVSASGGCPAQGGEATLPPAWSGFLDICPPDGPGKVCSDGSTCLQPPVGARVCIRSAVETSCPAGWGAATYDATPTFSDTRGCAPCSCAQGACSLPIFRVYDDNTCTENPTNISKPVSLIPTDGCRDVTPLFDAANWGMKQISKPVSLGEACSPGGGAPVGAVTPSGPKSVYCCL